MKIVLLGDSIRIGYSSIVETYYSSKGYAFFLQKIIVVILNISRLLFDQKEQLKDADVMI